MSWGISGDVGDDILQTLAQQFAMLMQRQQFQQQQQDRDLAMQDRSRQ